MLNDQEQPLSYLGAGNHGTHEPDEILLHKKHLLKESVLFLTIICCAGTARVMYRGHEDGSWFVD